MYSSGLGVSPGAPPPIPRRHPSRPSLRTASSSGTGTAIPPPPLPDDVPDRPTATRRPTSSLYSGDEAPRNGTVGLGFTGRVGLGSPRLEFFPRRDTGGSSGAGDGFDEQGVKGGRRGSYIDDRSGLPSPPGTESDAGVGKGAAAAETVKADEAITSATKPRLRPRTPSVASSTHSVQPLQRSTSSVTSHTQSSQRRLQPKATTGMTRSASSSSSVYTLSLRDVKLPGSSAGSSGMSDKSGTPSPVKRSSPALAALNDISPSKSSPPLSRHSSRHSLGTVPLKAPAGSGGSGRKASASSSGSRGGKGEAGSALSRHSSRLSLGSYSSADVQAQAEVVRVTESGRVEPARVITRIEPPSLRRSSRQISDAHAQPASEDETAIKLLRRISGSADYDDRIREAEAEVRRTNSRASRAEASSSTSHTHREDVSPQRHRDPPRTSPVISSNGGTLRRSATVSSASARALEGADTPERRGGTVATRGAAQEDSERDRSGGSAGSGKRKPLPAEFRPSGLFTPSPKQSNPPVAASGSSRASRVHQVVDSPEQPLSITPSPQKEPSSYHRGGNVDSPSSRFLKHEGIEGLDRSPTSSRRQWSESLSGLPSRSDRDHHGYPKPPPTREYRNTISRSTSVMDNHAPYDDRQRYQSRSSTLSSSSRIALTPGDSVSVVDRPNPYDSAKKDPLDVLRRIEESRKEHNRQWEEDRAASVLGDFESSPRAGSRRYERPGSSGDRIGAMPPSPARARPATSMSSVREAFDRDAPRSAPIHRLHRRAVEDAQMESPSARRATSRFSHGPPLTEPRQMRSSTSLGSGGGGRTSSLDAHSTKTEHGRLLLEAFRALELKLPPDLLMAVPDLVKSLQAAIVASENINSSIRESMFTANHTNVAIDLGNPSIDLLRRDFDTLLPLLREAGRASDQSIRELTRVILDLPKLLREGNRLGQSSSSPASVRTSQTQSPTVRRSESLLSRSSLDSTRSPDIDQRRWQNNPSSPVSNTYGAGGVTRERRSLDVMRPSGSMASFVSRFQRSPKKSEISGLPLPPIDQSPPREYEPHFSSPQPQYRRSESRSRSARNGELSLDSPPRESYDRYDHPNESPSHPPIPPPSRSPDRFRNMLKKKASSTSTHTVRAQPAGLGFAPLTSPSTSRTISHGAGGGAGSGSAFFPSPVRRTTTAISQVTVGDKSVRSSRSASTSDEPELEVGSPVSRFSFQGRAGSEEMEEEDEGDAIKMLAAAAKRREKDAGGGNEATGKWKSGWTRRTSK